MNINEISNSKTYGKQQTVKLLNKLTLKYYSKDAWDASFLEAEVIELNSAQFNVLKNTWYMTNVFVVPCFATGVASAPCFHTGSTYKINHPTWKRSKKFIARRCYKKGGVYFKAISDGEVFRLNSKTDVEFTFDLD